MLFSRYRNGEYFQIIRLGDFWEQVSKVIDPFEPRTHLDCIRWKKNSSFTCIVFKFNVPTFLLNFVTS